MDITQALKDTENALRDFIAKVLRDEYGEAWIDKCGVTESRRARWDERKTVEEKRQTTGVVDERLTYYADFYDLKTILKKHWSKFSDALGEWRTMEVWLSELEKLRDPDAHRRELLPHQKHLALGISGEIGTRLVRYRSKKETPEDYFPRIESARDNLGHIWTPDSILIWVVTRAILRPGDTIDFVTTAGDPLGEDLEYGIRINDEYPTKWQESNSFVVRVEDRHIGDGFEVAFLVRSCWKYHARGDHNHSVKFGYSVLPT